MILSIFMKIYPDEPWHGVGGGRPVSIETRIHVVLGQDSF
jgi:hypothetical protein